MEPHPQRETWRSTTEPLKRTSTTKQKSAVLLNFSAALELQSEQIAQKHITYVGDLKFRAHGIHTSNDIRRRQIVSWINMKLRSTNVLGNNNQILHSENGSECHTTARMPHWSPQITQEFKRSLEDRVAFDKMLSEAESSTETSESIQHFVEVCASSDLLLIADLVRPRIPTIIYSKFGSYLIQMLMKRSVEFLKQLETYVLQHVLQISCKDFSSRVLRLMIRLNDKVRKFVLDKFKSNFELCLQKFSAIFVLTETIRLTKDQNEYEFILTMLKNDPQRMLSNRYFKRILVAYLESCDPSKMNQVAHIMNLERSLVRFLRDKFGTFILIVLQNRQCAYMYRTFISHLKDDFDKVSQTNFFFMFMVKSLLLQPHASSGVHFLLFQLSPVLSSNYYNRPPSSILIYTYWLFRTCPKEHCDSIHFLELIRVLEYSRLTYNNQLPY